MVKNAWRRRTTWTPARPPEVPAKTASTRARWNALSNHATTPPPEDRQDGQVEGDQGQHDRRAAGQAQAVPDRRLVADREAQRTARGRGDDAGGGDDAEAVRHQPAGGGGQDEQ